MTAEIREVPKPTNPDPKNVIARLEETLALAKEGKILSLMMVMERADGDYSHCWSGHENCFALGGYMVMTGLRSMGIITKADL